jgi:phosphatidylserine synthase
MLRKVLAALLGPPDRLLSRLVGGGFGLKDVFTLANLVGGVASLAFAIAGNLWWASFAVMLGYLGDVLDGPVARVTGRGNRFGTELDNIADHTAQCVAPAFVVYLAYKGFHQPLAFTLAALLIVTGSIRHARGAAVHFGYRLAWHGMPRPVAAFLTIAFINSTIFSHLPGGRWVGVGLVVLVAVLNLVPLPFMNHHGRRLQLWAKLIVLWFFVSCAVTVLLLPRYFWDLLFIYVMAYAALSWIPMTPAERRDFFAASRAWRAALNGAAAPASAAPGGDAAAEPPKETP